MLTLKWRIICGCTIQTSLQQNRSGVSQRKGRDLLNA